MMVVKRYLSADRQKLLIRQCLNQEFEPLLVTVRTIPKLDLNKHFLQLYLSQAIKFGHLPSVTYLFNKFVVKYSYLMIRPDLLVDISNLMVKNNKNGFLDLIWNHYQKFYRYESVNDDIKYQLLKNKIEEYAMRPNDLTCFRKKWYKFIKELDNVLVDYPINVWDFPYLTSSLENTNEDLLWKLLFDDYNKGTFNQYTMPLLLNMILLQNHISQESKFLLFQHFIKISTCEGSVHLQDTLLILFKICDELKRFELINIVKEQNIQLTERTKRLINDVTLYEIVN